MADKDLTVTLKLNTRPFQEAINKMKEDGSLEEIMKEALKKSQISRIRPLCDGTDILPTLAIAPEDARFLEARRAQVEEIERWSRMSPRFLLYPPPTTPAASPAVDGPVGPKVSCVVIDEIRPRSLLRRVLSWFSRFNLVCTPAAHGKKKFTGYRRDT